MSLRWIWKDQSSSGLWVWKGEALIDRASQQSYLDEIKHFYKEFVEKFPKSALNDLPAIEFTNVRTEKRTYHPGIWDPGLDSNNVRTHDYRVVLHCRAEFVNKEKHQEFFNFISKEKLEITEQIKNM